jgi:hypothetical protein
MTLSSWTTSPNFTSDALWRTEIASINSALSAVGLVQTSDTGQYAGTESRPSTNTAGPYTIWKFNDGNQATYPCFIKIEYGTGAAASSMSFWVTVGTSTDGAGNLGSVKTTRTQFAQQATSASSYTSGVSGSSSRCTLGWCINSTTNQAIWFTIERIQNSSGSDTTTGLVIVGHRGALATSLVQCLYFGGGNQPLASTTFPTLTLNAPVSTTWVVGTDTGVGCVYPVGFGTHPPVHGGLTYFNSDLTAGNQYNTISLYSSNRNWIAFGSCISSMYNQHSSVTILCRWD